MSTNITVEKIDEAIAKAASFRSMTVEGETTAHQHIRSLMDVRNELKREEERNSGRRSTFATFDLSKQDF
jgi:hypothetical protein